MTNQSNKKVLSKEELDSSFVLTLLASSTALPGKAMPGEPLIIEALRKLLANQWATNIITGAASLAIGVAAGSGTGDILEVVLRSATAGLAVGGPLFLLFFLITLAYVRITPP